MAKIQIWTPLRRCSLLGGRLQESGLEPIVRHSISQVDATIPLVINYCEPLHLYLEQDPGLSLNPYQQILDSLEVLNRTGCKYRLINYDCYCHAGLVDWCCGRGDAGPVSHCNCDLVFPEPNAVEAAIAHRWLKESPGLLAAYLGLEAIGCGDDRCARMADCLCLERYEKASDRFRLIDHLRSHEALKGDLVELSAYVSSASEVRLKRAELQDCLISLDSRMRDAEINRRRYDELEHSFLLQQRDIQAMAKRIKILERAVNAGNFAGARIRLVLAKMLDATGCHK